MFDLRRPVAVRLRLPPHPGSSPLGVVPYLEPISGYGVRLPQPERNAWAANCPSAFMADLAGLVLEHRFATWELRPWRTDASFAVTIFRRP